MRLRVNVISLLPILLLAVLPLNARVVRVEIASRTDVLNGKAFGDAGAYERITGRIYFLLPVANPHNQRIVDLNNAVDLKSGEVEFSADFIAFRPKDAHKGNGSMILEVPNRGRGHIRLSLTVAIVISRATRGWVVTAQRVHRCESWMAMGRGRCRCLATLCAHCKRKRKDHHRPAARRSHAIESDAGDSIGSPDHSATSAESSTQLPLSDDPRNVLTVRDSRDSPSGRSSRVHGMAIRPRSRRQTLHPATGIFI